MRILMHLAAIILLASTAFAHEARAETGRERVQQQLTALHQWIGEGPNGQRWRSFLRSAELEAELPKGDRADPRVVRRVLGRYRSDAHGLGRPRFVAVRRALERWLSELPPVPREELPEVVRAAKDEFEPVTDQQVDQARAELQRALTDLEQFLARGPQDNHERWKRYLRWQPMLEQLEAEQPQLPVLREVSQQYFANVAGMESERFQRARRALGRFVDVIQVRNPQLKQRALLELFPTEAEQRRHEPLFRADSQESQYQALVEAVAERLEAFAESGSDQDAWVAGRLIGMLDQVGRAPEAVGAVREHYWQPNLFIRMSERLVAAGIEDPVTETTPVRENILGTSVFGTATLRGNVKVELVPSEEDARLNIRLAGIADSTSVGYNRSVQIFTTGVSNVSAAKQMVVDSNGLRTASAVARVMTRTTINNIAAHHNIVRKIAWNRATAQRPAAEQVASRRAEVRTSTRMDAQAANLLTDANQQFQERFRIPLIRLGAFPDQLKFRTTRDFLFVRMLQVSRDQLAAATPPPPIDDPRDMAAQVHESLAGNFTEMTLGGQNVNNVRMAELYEELTGEVPDELVVTEESELWALRFSHNRPVRTTFDAGEVRIALHANEFTRYGEDFTEVRDRLREDILISARYTVEQTADGFKLTRQDLSVDFPRAPAAIGIRRIGIRAFLGRKFDAAFKPEIIPEGIKLPGRWEDAGTLHVQSMDSQAGWLLLTWQLFPDNDRTSLTAHVADEP